MDGGVLSLKPVTNNVQGQALHLFATVVFASQHELGNCPLALLGPKATVASCLAKAPRPNRFALAACLEGKGLRCPKAKALGSLRTVGACTFGTPYANQGVRKSI